MTPAAEFRDAGRRYGARWALRHCSLDVEPGTITGIVGANGAGKTTMLHLLVGLTSPSEGSVAVIGRPAGDRAVLPDVAFVAQDAPLPRRMTVRALTDAAEHLNVRWDRTIVDRCVSELQLPPSLRIGELSGGQRARLALALAMAKRPTLLVLDEPVASLDPLARRSFLAAMLAAAVEEGTTVLFSTHLLDDLQRSCDHVVIVVAGTVRLHGSLDHVVADHCLLRGPPGLPGAPRAVRVVRSSHDTSVLVQGPPPVDPRWEVMAPTLEEIVLAHLATPDAVPRRAPPLEVVR